MGQPAEQSSHISGRTSPSRRGRPTAKRVAEIDAEIVHADRGTDGDVGLGGVLRLGSGGERKRTGCRKRSEDEPFHSFSVLVEPPREVRRRTGG